MHPIERPRERLALLGAEALRDEELLAVLLRAGCRSGGALALAQELIRLFPGKKLGELSLPDLRKIKGLGFSRAAAIAAASELGRRWSLKDQPQGTSFEDPAHVWENLYEFRDASRNISWPSI